MVDAAQRDAANIAMVKVCGRKAHDTFSVAMEGTGRKVVYVASGAWMTDEQIAAWKELLKADVAGKKISIYRKAKDLASKKADEYEKPKEKLAELGIGKKERDGQAFVEPGPGPKKQ